VIGTATPLVLGKSTGMTFIHGIRLHSQRNSIFGLEQRMILGLGILYVVQLGYIRFLLPTSCVEKYVILFIILFIFWFRRLTWHL